MERVTAPQAAGRMTPPGQPAAGPARLDVRCPQCGSLDQVGKVSALHAASTTQTTVRMQQQSLTGEWFTARGTATTRTHLARRLAPPRLSAWYMLPAAAAAVLAVMLLGSVGLIVNDPSGLTPSMVLGVAMVLLMLAGMLAGAVMLTVVGRRQHQAKLPQFHQRLKYWRSLFYCARCDKTFVPSTRRTPVTR